MISPVNSRLKFFSRAIALAVFVAGVLLASRGQADDPADAPDVAATSSSRTSAAPTRRSTRRFPAGFGAK